MTNSIKNQSPHAWSNILFISNFQISEKDPVIPDIRKKRHLQKIVTAENLVSETAEVQKEH